FLNPPPRTEHYSLSLHDALPIYADARTDVARRRGVVPWHVGRDDGGDDAARDGYNSHPRVGQWGSLACITRLGGSRDGAPREQRSEERRVGKGGGAGWWPEQ